MKDMKSMGNFFVISISLKIPKSFISCYIDDAGFNGKMGKFLPGIIFIAQHLVCVGFKGSFKG